MDEKFYEHLEEVAQAFTKLGMAAKEFTEKTEASLKDWGEWMQHRNNNNWLRMHGYPMVSRKRHQHERKRLYQKRDRRRKNDALDEIRLLR